WPRWSRLRRVEGAAEILGAIFGRHVDLDQLKVVGARDDVVGDAGRLRQAGTRLHRHVALDASETERDPALQDHHEVAGHVVPVPAGRLLERADGADVLRPDAPARGGGEAKVAVFI